MNISEDHRIVGAQYIGIEERDVHLMMFTERMGMLHTWIWDQVEGRWVQAVPGPARARGQLDRTRYPPPPPWREEGA
jgi:hypothetical protein